MAPTPSPPPLPVIPSQAVAPLPPPPPTPPMPLAYVVPPPPPIEEVAYMSNKTPYYPLPPAVATLFASKRLVKVVPPPSTSASDSSYGCLRVSPDASRGF